MHWLLEALRGRLPPESSAWLQEAVRAITTRPETRTFFAYFSLALRKSGKAPLQPGAALVSEAGLAVPGWDPSGWTCEQAARAAILLALPPGPVHARWMDQLHETADVGEAVALLQALPLLPLPHLHLARAREGARSNVRLQFEAVALGNPYPAAWFDEGAWNQMVAKALFVGSPLHRIIGLDRRSNPELARMLVDHVAERRAAGRPYDPALWSCVDACAEAAGGTSRALELRKP